MGTQEIFEMRDTHTLSFATSKKTIETHKMT